MKRLYYSFAYLFLLGLPAGILIFFFLRNNINYKALFGVIIITLIVGGVFDIWAVRQSKNDKFFIWEYNSKSIIGFKIFGVPIEDYVFFLVLTPFFIISFYEGIKMVLINNYSLQLPIIISILTLALSYYIVYKHAIRSKK